MNTRSQLLKGVLEGCILAIFREELADGYELSVKLHEHGLTNISEGSIYPILLRLQKEKVIEGHMQPSPSGPRRKYYHLTDAGHEALANFTQHWNTIKGPVDSIIKGGRDQ